MSEDIGNSRFVLRVCLVATLGGLLFGYDTAVIAGAIGFLQKKFSLSPAMEGWTASCALLGCVIGVAMSGLVSDRFGRKKLLALSGVLFAISAVGTALPPSLAWFVVFRTIGGIGIGAASMASPMYIAEIAPPRVRGKLVSVNQLAIVFGIVGVYFVNYLIAHGAEEAWNVEYGWRWMFASGLVPALVFLGLLTTVPESPRWLTEQGRRREAFQILARVNGTAKAEAELREIEGAAAVESATLSQLLRAGPPLVLIIGVSLAVLQQITGINAFLYYAPEIFKRLGSGTDAALLQTVTIGAVNLFFTVVAIYTVDRWGRRPLMLVGAAGMAVCLFAMGAAAYLGRTDLWLIVTIMGYIACFALSIGPVTWVILSEIFPTKIRGRALSLCTFCLWGANFIISQTFPIVSENQWLVKNFHHAFPFWFFAILAVVELIFVWKLVPETKGKSLEEIERLLGTAAPRTPEKQRDSVSI